MNSTVLLVLFSILSYLVGNCNWALIISKTKNKDIRKMGSGNPGTLNMSRNFGLKIGLLTFVLDILKGAIPTLIAYFVFKNYGCFKGTDFYIFDFAIYLCGLSVVLGHIFPVIFKFKGGKGIASTIGVFLVTESIHGLSWAMIAVMALVAAAVFIYLTEFGAMGSFIAITPPAISGAIKLFITYGHNHLTGTAIFYYVATNMFIFTICFFTWFAHRKNIERMLAGEEHLTSIKAMVVKMRAKKAQNKSDISNFFNDSNKN